MKGFRTTFDRSLEWSNTLPTPAGAVHQCTIPTNRGHALLELFQPVRATGCNQCRYSPFTDGPHQQVWCGACVYKNNEPHILWRSSTSYANCVKWCVGMMKWAEEMNHHPLDGARVHSCSSLGAAQLHPLYTQLNHCRLQFSRNNSKARGSIFVTRNCVAQVGLSVSQILSPWGTCFEDVEVSQRDLWRICE